ncbi:MAG: hypothetical protein QE263_04605 [Vampirovibrionales bacterium]|nr:hypothetical protein [Vampirovibrionales bacterium]
MIAGHSLVAGRSGFGKTTLVKGLAQRFSDGGTPVLVLTTFPQDSWPADYITDNPEEFIEKVFFHTGCFVVVDEGGEFAGQYNKTMSKLATRGRHNGHICVFIAQRATMINVNIRANCNNLFIFKSCVDDCKILANDFAVSDLTGASNLEPGKCIAVIGSQEPQLMRVF